MKVNFELPKFQVLDDDGAPLVGGKVYFYEAGTTTLKDTYADAEGTVKNPNPVILDSRGEADIFLDRDPYKIRVTTFTDVPVFTRDNYQGFMDADDNQAEDLLINSDARVNQINYSSGSALAVDDYLYDMWKCSAAGSVTFTAGGSITLAAGTKIKQKNDDLMDLDGVEVTAFVESGQVTVNGLGLSSATVISPGTPVTWTINTATSEWFEIGSASAETFSGLHIVKGDSATNVRYRTITEEELRCWRYFAPFLRCYQTTDDVPVFRGFYPAGSAVVYMTVMFPVPMASVSRVEEAVVGAGSSNGYRLLGDTLNTIATASGFGLWGGATNPDDVGATFEILHTGSATNDELVDVMVVSAATNRSIIKLFADARY